MTDELRDNARQHGRAVAEAVAQKIQREGMTPERAIELLNVYVVTHAEGMMKRGTSRDDIVAWVRALEAAFDERLSELAGPDTTH